MDKGTVVVLSTAIVTIGIVLVVALFTGHDTVLALSGLMTISAIAGYKYGRRKE